jgi:hypothetical protein
MRFAVSKQVLAGVAALGLAVGFLSPSLAAAQEGEPTPMVIEGPEPTTGEQPLESVREGWKV